MRQLPEQISKTASQSEKPPVDVLIDTDIGDDIDDALALSVALNSPEIAVHAITTVFGDTQRRAQLVAYLLHTFGHDDIPVAAGIQSPLQFRHRPSGVPQAAILPVLSGHETYSAISSLTGPELIIQTALAYSGRLTLVCIGPLTNIATALTLEPQLFTAIRSIVMMGGSSGLPLPDWNVRSDAKAAQIVLASGIPVTMVGLNITSRCKLRACDIAQLQSSNTLQAQLLSRLLVVWQEHRSRWHSRLPYLHDPLTVAALCNPALFRFQDMTARVLTHGPLQGFTVPRFMHGPIVNAVVDVQVGQAREWVMQRLIASSHTQTT
ncbi:MAG TPA: nucleoside hydrolase [Ktedonobacteraceae bacterium]|nr:nucleoside hydrolase [Ktedonobacteraceae bacterium]